MLLTAKPVVYLVNLSERDFVRKKNKWLPKIKAWIDEHNPGDPLIPFSVALEERLAPLEGQEKKDEEGRVGAASALPKIITAGYQCLDLIRYFTCGPDEVRAWTIRSGTKAPQAAGVIHSDFENKFVCGEIMSYEDLKECGSEAAVKAVRPLGFSSLLPADGLPAGWESTAAGKTLRHDRWGYSLLEGRPMIALLLLDSYYLPFPLSTSPLYVPEGR